MTDNDDETGETLHEKNLKIFVRIFPLERSCESCAKLDMGRKKIYVRCLQDMQPNRITPARKPSYWCFQVDGIFCDSSQQEVYRDTAEDLVSKNTDYVRCFSQHRGLVARLLTHMFAERTNRKHVDRIEYRVSFVELYGREVKDLLAPDTENRVKINDRDPFKDISALFIDNEEHGLKKIFEGEFRRSIAKGSTYPASHLATAVITFHVTNTSLITSWGIVTTAKMHIVEAAGTGTVGRNFDWKTATDVGTANLTKTQIEQFFACLAGSGSSLNMARSSNLLKILGSAFSVSSVIRFISHIRISKEDLDITLSTLRFTAKIQRLKPVRMREDIGYRSDLMVHRLQDEVNALKKELMLNDLFLCQEARMNISKARMAQIYRSVLGFLNGDISDFTLFSASQAQVLLKSIKDLHNRLTARELELEQLKKTYENLLKTVSQETVVPTDDQVNNRKRTKSASQVIVEVEEVGKEAEKEEVGSIDKTAAGVTLGPYTEKEIEALETSENAKLSATTEQILKIDDQNMETVRQLFERFLREEKEFAKMKEKFDQIDKTLVNARQRFSNAMDNYFQARRNLNDAHDKLCKQRRIRYVLELERREGSEMLLEMERAIDREISCYQKVLMNLEEEVNRAQEELGMLSNRYIEMTSRLRFGFREYCKRKDLSLYCTDKSMRILLEPIKKESLEIIRRKFNKFQRTLLRKAEVANGTKKACAENKHRSHSANLYLTKIVHPHRNKS